MNQAGQEAGHDSGRDPFSAPFLGVLGGMGPMAGAAFMARLTALTEASSDQEHIPAILWSDPRVPDRTRSRQLAVVGGVLLSFARSEPGARAALQARRRRRTPAGVTAGGGLPRRGR